jgi:hypothetical protein
MSFDLLIETTDPRARERVSEALAGHPVELRESASALLVGFSAGTSDAAMRRAYGVLVQLATTHDLSITDPQAGVRIDLTSPQRVPPGWKPALTFAEVRKLTKKGQFSRLLPALDRIADVNGCDRRGETLLCIVLADAWDQGPTARSYDGRPLMRAAEDIALALITRGADPLKRSTSGASPIRWAVLTNSDRLVTAILAKLDAPARAALLDEKFPGGQLLDIARTHAATRAEKVLRNALA